MPENALRSDLIRQQVLPWLIVAAVVFSFRDAVADWYDVPSGSMLPTLRIGDRIAVDKLAYDVRVPFTDLVLFERDQPKRGDIVTLKSPVDGTRLVKRVVAVAGDELAMRDGALWIDGAPVKRTLIEGDAWRDDMPVDMQRYRAFREDLGPHDDGHVVLDMIGQRGTPDFGPIEVPRGHVVVMGDNRDRSGDSRAFGFVSKKQIEGRVLGIAFSLDHDEHGKRTWRLRGDRFLHDPDA